MVTSVGMFGLPGGFAPIAWMYGVPLLVTVGMIEPRAVCEDGRVIARPTLPLSATIDHRFVDGWHLGQAMQALRGYLAAPEAFEPALRVCSAG
jgi:pyruvate dehydrogenase E2 component (dihydrolipoamide acetyltransferase)